jgi:nitrous oxidase accessory protein
MKKRYLVIGIIISLVCMSITPSYAVDNVKKSSTPIFNGDILYVGGNGTGNYTSIQGAIDDADSGDTVFVFGDSSPYHENIVVDKSIFLIGEDKNMVVIDADFKGAAVKITSDDVFVSGFTMIHPHKPINELWDSTLVDIVTAENVTVKNNLIQQDIAEFGDYRAGIVIRYSSYCFIKNNTIIQGDGRPSLGVAVILGSSFNNISGNEIHNYAWAVSIPKAGCTDNIIYENYLHHNTLFGIEINSCDNNKIIGNVINFNSFRGISIESSSSNVIIGNNITNNGGGDDFDGGISIDSSTNNHISYNYVSNNNPCGIHIYFFSNVNDVIFNQIISNKEIGVFCDFVYNSNITLNNISKNKIGVNCYLGNKNYIAKNNFIDNKKNANFYYPMIKGFIRRNIWDENYWNKPSSRPHLIFGKRLFLEWTLPCIVFDWHPSQEPYDIPTGM